MEEKKLNIGLFIDTWFPMIDGVISVVDNYARHLSKVANVTVFAPNSGKVENINSLPYKLVRCKSMKVVGLDYVLPLPSLDKKFKRELKKANLDIIHIHSPFTIGKMATTFGKKNNIPVVATFHSQYERDFYKVTKSHLLTKILLKKIIKVFNMSNLLLTMNSKCVEIIKNYGYKGRVKILPNGTNLKSEINLSKYTEEIYDKYKINNEQKILISIGRLVKLKNIDLVIESCKILKQKNFNFKLLIVGGGQDELYFKKKVKELSLSSEIDFIGKIYDNKLKSAYLSIADLNVFPSFYDTDGIVKIEAAAFETPTLFAKGSVASASCSDNINGYIANPDPISFANKIINIFRDLNYQNVCKNAKKDLYKTWDQIIKKLFIIYNKEIKND